MNEAGGLQALLKTVSIQQQKLVEESNRKLLGEFLAEAEQKAEARVAASEDKLRKEFAAMSSGFQNEVKKLTETVEGLKINGMKSAVGGAGTSSANSQTGSTSKIDHKIGKLKDEIQMKLERRVTVNGFMGNANKDEREQAVNAFLEGLGTMKSYGAYEVFAKGVTGSEVIVQFGSRDRASQFIKDNLKEIKTFRVKGKSGELRDAYFSLHMDGDQWKAYHATRLLASAIVASGKLESLTVKGLKHKGVVSINDFDILKIKVDMGGIVQYKYIKKNIEDLGVEGMETKLKVIVDAFAASFK